MDIIKIQTLPNAPIRKRVVAYARVSKEKESMIHSLNAQVSYYSKYIQRHKGWKDFRKIPSDTASWHPAPSC